MNESQTLISIFTTSTTSVKRHAIPSYQSKDMMK